MKILESILKEEVLDEIMFERLQELYINRVAEFADYNTVINPGGIVFVGDSITEGMRLSELLPDYYCINRGICGDTTDGVLNRLDESIYALHPSKVFLMIGTNDFYTGDEPKEKCVSNIKKIILGIQNELPDTQVYLESIYPINKGDIEKIDTKTLGERTNALIDENNAVLKKSADELNITYIDVNSHLKNDIGDLKLEYTAEGLHLTAMGYKKVIEILHPYIEQTG